MVTSNITFNFYVLVNQNIHELLMLFCQNTAHPLFVSTVSLESLFA